MNIQILTEHLYLLSSQHVDIKYNSQALGYTVIFVIFIKIKYFPFWCLYFSLLYAESPNFEVFYKFWYNPFFLLYNKKKKVKIEALKGKIFNFNENNENHKVYPSACDIIG